MPSMPWPLPKNNKMRRKITLSLLTLFSVACLVLSLVALTAVLLFVHL